MPPYPQPALVAAKPWGLDRELPEAFCCRLALLESPPGLTALVVAMSRRRALPAGTEALSPGK